MGASTHSRVLLGLVLSCTNTKPKVLHISKKSNQIFEHEKHFIYSVSTTLSQWCKHLQHSTALREGHSDDLYLQIMINDAKLLLGDFKERILPVSGGPSITYLSPFVSSLHSYLIWSGALWGIIKRVLWWKSHWLESLNLSFRPRCFVVVLVNRGSPVVGGNGADQRRTDKANIGHSIVMLAESVWLSWWRSPWTVCVDPH